MSAVILEGKGKPEAVTREEVEAFAVEVSQGMAELFRRTEVISQNFLGLVQALIAAGVINDDQAEGENDSDAPERESQGTCTDCNKQDGPCHCGDTLGCTC